MTTEEKAKAYDEALERAKDCLTNKKFKDIDDTPEDLTTYIFPQLAESEDEQTKRRLMEFISDVKTISESGRRTWAVRKDDVEMCNAFLAYLEKQKDHFRDDTKMVEQKEIPLMNGDADLYFDNWIQHNDTTKRGCFEEGIRYATRLQKEQEPITDSIKFEEGFKTELELGLRKQKEQKAYVNTDYFKSFMLQYLQDAANKKDDSEIEAATNYWMEKLLGLTKWQKEQKPAEWNEEDKSFYNSIMCEVVKEGMHPTPEQAKWFKSLPERFNLQPKNKWSEEDEKMIDTIVSVLSQYIDYKAVSGTGSEYATPRYSKEIAFLKSLRSRPKSSDNWKPSEQEKGALRTAIHVLTEERNFPKAAAHLQVILDVFDKETRKEFKPNEEQMEALKWLVEYVAHSEKYIVSIKNLYDDLKKLM